MVLESSVALLTRRREGSGRCEIVPIEETLSFEQGFYAVIRACQLLSNMNDGLILVGLAGPSGAGKSFFTKNLRNYISGIAIINMDSYTDATRLIDADFDDKRLTDYDTLLANIRGLKDGESVQVPVYDSKSNSRIGYSTLELPSSRIVILEGIHALSEKLRPFLDLGVSVTGGVHFDLVKRVYLDIQSVRQLPEDILLHIFETVYPTYTALIQPDLDTAHIKIDNNFDPVGGLLNHPTYILKSTKVVTPEQMKAVLSEDFKERTEETDDIYVLPPCQDPGTYQSYLRMRNRDGKYSLVYEEWLTVHPFIISPRITLQVNVRLLGGLMTMGYNVATILKRKSHIFDDDKVIVKIDCLEQLNRTYVQVQGRDRRSVENVANQLGLEPASYVSNTYIEQMQLEKLVNGVMALPDELKAKISLIPSHGGGVSNFYTNQRRNVNRAPALPARLPNQGVNTQLLEQISTLNERMDELTSRVGELNSNIPNRIAAAAASGPFLSLSSSSSPLMKEVVLLAGRQRQTMLQMDILSNLIHEHVGERSRTERGDSNNTTQSLAHSTVPVLLALAIGCIGILAYRLK